MALAANLGHLLHLAEVQAMGGAGCYTGRIQAGINALHTVIAFDHFTRFSVPLGRTPGTGRDAGFASHAQVVIHENDAVLTTLLHGAGGAGSHTPGIFAVVAGYEDIRCSWEVSDVPGAHFNHLTQPGAGRQVFVDFALYFAGTAADALACILEQVVLTHGFPPFVMIDTIIAGKGKQVRTLQPPAPGNQKQISYHH